MPQEGFKRKLTAILSADVIGYSRLMRDDEEATVRDIATHRILITEIIQQYHGRVVDSPGDNILAEFTSVVEAVNGAIKIQDELKKINTGIAQNRRMEFRIGINLGDVIEEEERIYGDGVNIAARVEGLSAAGGISISGTVYEHIKDKLSLGYHYLGEQNVKNIPEPVRVYWLLTEPEDAGKMIGAEKPKAGKWRWAILGAISIIILVAGMITIWNYGQHSTIEVASVESMALPLPDKPSIAVLPFDNLSEDPKQEYFSDGITEDLIVDLSKIKGLFVIARNSVFIYKGKAVKIADLGRELGVRYVLEGSVRKANGRVRITAQLVDATTEGHLWAERYDRDLKDIFALQDEVTQKIVAALAVTLTADEQKRLVRKYTDNIEAYDLYLQGAEYKKPFTKEANVRARQMFERAIDLDPEFAAAYGRLGFTYFHDWTFGWSQDPQSLEHAFELAQRSLDLDDSLPLGHHLLGKAYLWKKQYAKAIAELEKAIALSPNDADQLVGLGYILDFAGRPEEAIGLVKKAMRLNPIYPVYYLWELGHAYFLTGRYQKAIETLKRALDRNSDFMPAHVYLAASYIEIGKQQEARAQAAEVGRLTPHTSLEAMRQRTPYQDQAVIERLFDSLRKAGLK